MVTKKYAMGGNDAPAVSPLVIAFALSLAALPVVAARNAERDGIGTLSLQDIATLGGKKKPAFTAFQRLRR